MIEMPPPPPKPGDTTDLMAPPQSLVHMTGQHFMLWGGLVLVVLGLRLFFKWVDKKVD